MNFQTDISNTYNMSLIIKTFFCFPLSFFAHAKRRQFFFEKQEDVVLSSEPDYTKSQHFFLWGLVGSAEVDADHQICDSRKILQMQTQMTYQDILWPLLIGAVSGTALALSVIDGGIAGLMGFLFGIYIYQPKTVKVWCAPEGTSL